MWFVAIVLFVALTLLFLSRVVFPYFTILNSIEPTHKKCDGNSAPFSKITGINNPNPSLSKPVNGLDRIKGEMPVKEKDTATFP